MILDYTISPPMPRYPGDKFIRVGDVLEQRVNGSLVAFRNLAEMASTPLVGPATSGGPITHFFQEVPMATVETCTSVQLPPTGDIRIRVGFSSGTQLEFADAADAVSQFNGEISGGVEGAQWCRLALIKRWWLKNPAMDDASYILGKTIQIGLDLELNQLSIGEQ